MNLIINNDYPIFIYELFQSDNDNLAFYNLKIETYVIHIYPCENKMSWNSFYEKKLADEYQSLINKLSIFNLLDYIEPIKKKKEYLKIGIKVHNINQKSIDNSQRNSKFTLELINNIIIAILQIQNRLLVNFMQCSLIKIRGDTQYNLTII